MLMWYGESNVKLEAFGCNELASRRCFAVKESALILLQTAPTHIDVTELKSKLLAKV